MIKYILCALAIAACGPRSSKEITTPSPTPQTLKGYDLMNPSARFILPNELGEISGLEYDAERNVLAAINDEKGIIYDLDIDSGQILDDHKFEKPGDYEGVAVTPEGYVVVRSDGNIYKPEKKGKSIKIKTALNESNDVEGLCYVASTNHLLLACKGQSKIRNVTLTNPSRTIYQFDLNTSKLDPTPFLEIVNTELQAILKSRKKYTEAGLIEKSLKMDRIRSFAPSGIAVHPITGDYYILSSRGKLLVQINSAKEIVDISFLDQSQHTQPEGISFTQNGDLYISNEGRHLTAKLFKYNYLP